MKRVLSFLACLGAATLLLTAFGPQVSPEEKKAADEKAMMDAWMRYATPGEHHKALNPLVGTWSAEVESWMAPGASSEKSAGTTTIDWVLGGRYLEQKHEGSMMGQPFSGIGYTGYDNAEKKYVSTWMDSAGTGIMMMSGTADASGRVITSTGIMADPIAGKPMELKSIMTIADNDNVLYEMWGPGPDGKPFKMIAIHYTRKK